MNYRPYPAYKDSNIEWLGQVPGHWEVLAVRRVSQRIKTGSTPPTAEDQYYQDGTVPWFGPGSFSDQITLSNPMKFINESAFHDGTARLFRFGATMVITIGATLGKVSSLAADASCNQQITVIEFNERRVHPRFGTYQLKRLESALRAVAPSATLPILAQGDIADVFVAIPPLPEQRAIADFLDAKTARLDSLVAKNRALIEKLKEKRTALISRTVTLGLPPEAARAAGLDAHPKLKPSGVEWLGEIPEHWEIIQLKWAVKFQRGHDLPADQRQDGDVPVVSSAGVSSKHDIAIATGPGLVTGRYGTIGQFHLVEEDYWPLNTTLYSIDLRGNVPRFLRYMLDHLSPLFLLNAVKSAVPGVDRNDLHPTETSIPPLFEQYAIADYLDRETEKLDRLAEKVQTAIEKLQEYRNALISAAVTGKIDVRCRLR